jgi:ADP-ribose pyrophosphatase
MSGDEMGEELLREDKISGQRVYGGRILDLEVDRVRLPNGTETTREVVRHAGAAVVLPIHEDGQVVLVRQYRYPMAEILLELPAGKVDPGESPKECATRELAEEIGWRAGEIHALGSFFTTPGFTDELLHAFVAIDLEPAPDVVADPDEAIEIMTMTVDAALAACRDGRIRDGKTIAVFLMAQLHGWI